jgi:hypothetical protein
MPPLSHLFARYLAPLLRAFICRCFSPAFCRHLQIFADAYRWRYCHGARCRFITNICQPPPSLLPI